MICPNPISVNGKTRTFGRADQILVPCGRCLSCLSNRRADWTKRLEEELRAAVSAHFLTLTYQDKYLPRTSENVPTLTKRHIQLFLKRIRNFERRVVLDPKNLVNGLKTEEKAPPVRYFATGEYGSQTERPHYHLLIFNVSDETIQNLDELWDKKGNIVVGSVATASIHYVTKYLITNDLQPIHRAKPFNLMSKGIGKSYVPRTKDWHRKTDKKYMNRGGVAQSLPRYYKQKIWTEEEMQEDENQRLIDIKIRSIKEEKDLIQRGIKDPIKYKRDTERIIEENLQRKIKKGNTL